MWGKLQIRTRQSTGMDYFKEECKIIQSFKKQYNDHFLLRYKLPIDWDLERHRAIPVKRKYNKFQQQIPLFFFILGTFGSFMSLRGIHYGIRYKLIVPDTMTQLQIHVRSVAGCFTLGGIFAYRIELITYAADIFSGMNMLIKLYRRLPKPTILPKRKFDVANFIIQFGILVSCYPLYVGLLGVIYLKLDPVIHCLTQLDRRIHILKFAKRI